MVIGYREVRYISLGMVKWSELGGLGTHAIYQRIFVQNMTTRTKKTTKHCRENFKLQQ